MEGLLSAWAPRSRRGSEKGAGNLLQRHPGILEWDGESGSSGSLLTFLEILEFGQTQTGTVGLLCCWGGWWLQSGKERQTLLLAECCPGEGPAPQRPPVCSGEGLCVAFARCNHACVFLKQIPPTCRAGWWGALSIIPGPSPTPQGVKATLVGLRHPLAQLHSPAQGLAASEPATQGLGP